MKAFFRLLAILLALVPVAPGRADDLLIQAAKVYTMTGSPLTPGAVLISDGKIAQVGSKLTAPAGARVIDAAVVMPGLVDAYTHAAVVGGPAETTREITPEYRVLPAVDWRAR